MLKNIIVVTGGAGFVGSNLIFGSEQELFPGWGLIILLSSAIITTRRNAIILIYIPTKLINK